MDPQSIGVIASELVAGARAATHASITQSIVACDSDATAAACTSA